MPFASLARVGIVTLSLAVGDLVTAAPAQAAPKFSFEFSFGKQPTFHGHHRRAPRCLGDQGVVWLLRDAGFRNVSFRGGRGEHVHLRAIKGRWLYAVIVDRCPGRIVDVDRLRRR